MSKKYGNARNKFLLCALVPLVTVELGGAIYAGIKVATQPTPDLNQTLHSGKIQTPTGEVNGLLTNNFKITTDRKYNFTLNLSSLQDGIPTQGSFIFSTTKKDSSETQQIKNPEKIVIKMNSIELVKDQSWFMLEDSIIIDSSILNGNDTLTISNLEYTKANNDVYSYFHFDSPEPFAVPHKINYNSSYPGVAEFVIPDTAKTGQDVTITAKAVNDYELSQVVVSGKSTLTKKTYSFNNTTSVTFVMPNEDVNITIEAAVLILPDSWTISSPNPFPEVGETSSVVTVTAKLMKDKKICPLPVGYELRSVQKTFSEPFAEVIAIAPKEGSKGQYDLKLKINTEYGEVQENQQYLASPDFEIIYDNQVKKTISNSTEYGIKYNSYITYDGEKNIEWTFSETTKTYTITGFHCNSYVTSVPVLKLNFIGSTTAEPIKAEIINWQLQNKSFDIKITAESLLYTEVNFEFTNPATNWTITLPNFTFNVTGNHFIDKTVSKDLEEPGPNLDYKYFTFEFLLNTFSPSYSKEQKFGNKTLKTFIGGYDTETKEAFINQLKELNNKGIYFKDSLEDFNNFIYFESVGSFEYLIIKNIYCKETITTSDLKLTIPLYCEITDEQNNSKILWNESLEVNFNVVGHKYTLKGIKEYGIQSYSFTDEDGNQISSIEKGKPFYVNATAYTDYFINAITIKQDGYADNTIPTETSPTQIHKKIEEGITGDVSITIQAKTPGVAYLEIANNTEYLTSQSGSKIEIKTGIQETKELTFTWDKTPTGALTKNDFIATPSTSEQIQIQTKIENNQLILTITLNFTEEPLETPKITIKDRTIEINKPSSLPEGIETITCIRQSSGKDVFDVGAIKNKVNILEYTAAPGYEIENYKPDLDPTKVEYEFVKDLSSSTKRVYKLIFKENEDFTLNFSGSFTKINYKVNSSIAKQFKNVLKPEKPIVFWKNSEQEEAATTELSNATVNDTIHFKFNINNTAQYEIEETCIDISGISFHYEKATSKGHFQIPANNVTLALKNNPTTKKYSINTVALGKKITHDIKSSYEYGTIVTFSLKPEEGYDLPGKITIKNGETELKENDEYTYDSKTGKVTISKITSNLTISSDAAKAKTADVKIEYKDFTPGEGSTESFKIEFDTPDQEGGIPVTIEICELKTLNDFKKIGYECCNISIIEKEEENPFYDETLEIGYWKFTLTKAQINAHIKGDKTISISFYKKTTL